MPRDRDRRDPAGRRAPASPVERQAEEDLARMKGLLQRTRAEVARSNKLADSIEQRTGGPSHDKTGRKK